MTRPMHCPLQRHARSLRVVHHAGLPGSCARIKGQERGEGLTHSIIAEWVLVVLSLGHVGLTFTIAAQLLLLFCALPLYTRVREISNVSNAEQPAT